MKILMLASHFPPEVGVASERAEFFYDYLSHRCKTTMMTRWVPNGSRPGVREIVGPPDRFLPGLAPGFGLVPHALVAGRSLDYDTVYASSPPIGVAFAGMMLAKRNGSRFVLEVRDVWPFDPAAKNYEKDLKLAKRVCDRADRIIVTNDGLKDFLTREYGLNPEKVEVIYTGAPKISLPKAVKQDKFTILYCGSIYLTRALDKLLRGIAKSGVDAHIMFLGLGADRARLESLAKELGIDASFMGIRRGAAFIHEANKADVHFVGVDDNIFLKYRISGTIYSAMALGKPVIATGVHDGDTARLIESTGMGLFVPPDADSIADAVRRLHADRELRRRLGENAAAAGRKYSRSAAAEKLWKTLVNADD